VRVGYVDVVCGVCIVGDGCMIGSVVVGMVIGIAFDVCVGFSINVGGVVVGCGCVG